jgi:sucrose-phosphate synthase
VFVLSSLYEPFGLAPIEAGACGLAVVATRNGGPSEIFADGSGVLVDPANPADIAEGIARALKDHGRYAERIRHRVHSTYTWERTAESYLAVIEAGCRSTSTMRSNAIELDATVPLKRYLARRGE